MKEKSEVETILKKFYTMLQTQFQKNIQILQSDNGREYFKNMLSQFFLEKGLVHQSSCVNTLQQNGLAERKNKHLLEVAWALLFTNQVPKYLWGEAVLTTTYLINRMPNKVLSFETPFDVFHKFIQQIGFLLLYH
jgi:IS30 family transposase